MILVMDCGATKADYAMVDAASGTVAYGTCHGMNASLATDLEMDAFFSSLPDSGKVTRLWFYGAGCLPGAISDRVCRSAVRHMPGASGRVYAGSDMEGAARALHGSEPGVACILGTGSNSCIYDGNTIIDQIPSLGYILGDEGSANHMGRLLLSAVYKRQCPPALSALFSQAYPGLDVAAVVERVYRSGPPASWLGSLARFLTDNINEPGAREIVLRSFEAFVTGSLLPYGDAVRELPIGFVGSVAVHFRECLDEVLGSHGLHVGRVVARPLEALTAAVTGCHGS